MINVDASSQLISATKENIVTERTTDGASPAINAKAARHNRINLSTAPLVLGIDSG
jgi:hypothetical protein